MSAPISIHRYTLVSCSALNSRSDRLEHHGALIRVGESDFGYGCIHPWPELGDLDLQQTLQCLKNGEVTPLIRQAMHCAERDADARRAGVSLFEGVQVPMSHATVKFDAESFSEAKAAGFTTVKVKLGRNLTAESEQMMSLAKAFPDFRWRLDFNHTRSLAEVEGFLQALGGEFCKKIDFMEDAWSEGDQPEGHLLGVPLAVDRGVETNAENFPVSVVKPACNEVDAILQRAQTSGSKVVFTSYMDHPVGQSYAAWQAGVAASHFSSVVDTCGLITHGLFEPNAFTECLGTPSPQFNPATGTGLGFDDLLAELEWTPLT
ncbi:MAG: hypothetical protein AB8F34_07355 [Akkermansiaceae bacterium]